MDISELCNELLKKERDARTISLDEVDAYVETTARTLAKHAPDILEVVAATPFNAFAAIALLIKLVTEVEGEIKAEGKLDQLITSSYWAGLDHLRYAASVSKKEARNAQLNEASNNFITASRALRSPVLVAKAKFFAGVCFKLLGEEETALNLYKEAYEIGQQEMLKRLRGVAVTKEIGEGAVGGGIAVLGLGLGGFVLGATLAAAPLALVSVPVAAALLVKLAQQKSGARTAKKVQEELALALDKFADKLSELTGETVDFLKAKEIQEMRAFQANFLLPLSALLERGEGR